MEEKKISKSIVYSIVAVLLVVIVAAGATYAYFRAAGETALQEITTADLGISFVDGELLNAKLEPIEREDILSKAAKKTFTITNTGEEKLFVHIRMEDMVLPEALKRYDFMWSLYEGDKNVSNGTFADAKGTKVDIAPYQVFESGASKTYHLYVWIEETYLDQVAMMGKVFNTKIKAVGETYYTSPESDFIFSNGTIIGYNGPGGTVIIPETIGGVEVTTISDLGAIWVEDGNGDYKAIRINKLVIPDTVTYIGEEAFYDNNLTSVVIPNSVTSIGSKAFYLSSIETVSIPNSVTSIGEEAFGVNRLTNVVIPNSVTSIGSKTFNENQLTNVVIPNSVTEIGNQAFYQNQLTNVVIGNSVTSIGSYAFGDNQLTNVVIGNSVTTIGAYAFYDNQLTNVVIPNSVTSIGSSAFDSNQLTNVVIPNSVTEIGGTAFFENQLTNVVIGNSVTTIGDWAFEDNPNLTSIIIKKPSAESMTLGEYWSGSCPTENIIYNPNY